MTVCIAAACRANGKARIVLCHDWQGTLPFMGSSESFDKLRYLAKNWIALLSGTIPRAEELCVLLEDRFKTEPTSIGEALQQVRSGVFEYKDRLIEQHLRAIYGLDFATLRDKGKTIYPESLLLQVHREISEISAGVDLIVTGFVKMLDYTDGSLFMYPCIIQVSANGSQPDISIQDSFACIGEGAPSATSSLLFREHSEWWNFKNTVYAVYEAKRLAEIVPTVGGDTSLYIQSEHEPLRYVSNEGFENCRQMFKKHGPKKVTRDDWKAFDLKIDAHFLKEERSPRRPKTPRSKENNASSESASQTSAGSQ
jgi:hypothetical protein